MQHNQDNKKGKLQHVDKERIKPMDVEGFKVTANSTHPVSTYRKDNKPELTSNAWVAKFLDEDKKEKPSLFEIEAAVGDFYRLLIGSRQPKVRVIAKNTQESFSETVGAMSKLVEQYTPISERQIDVENINHIRQLAEITVVAFFLEEADLSDDNLGFNQKNELIKIDHGQSLWSLIIEQLTPGRSIDFRMSPDVIHKIPLSINGHGLPLDKSLLKTLSTSSEFIKAKFKALLKIVLMTDEICHSITDVFIKSSPYLKNRVATHLIQKRNELLKTLMSMPDFSKFIKDNPEIINAIKNEYMEFNKEFYKAKHADRKIDIGKIESSYDEILKEIQSRDLAISEEIKSRGLKLNLLSKFQKRINKLSEDNSPLALLKKLLFTEIQTAVTKAVSLDEINGQFNKWLNKIYHLENSEYDGKTYKEIMSLSRNLFDVRTTKSAALVTKIEDLLLKSKLPANDSNMVDVSQVQKITSGKG